MKFQNAELNSQEEIGLPSTLAKIETRENEGLRLLQSHGFENVVVNRRSAALIFLLLFVGTSLAYTILPVLWFRQGHPSAR
jgi:hypothetical protein